MKLPRFAIRAVFAAVVVLVAAVMLALFAFRSGSQSRSLAANPPALPVAERPPPADSVGVDAPHAETSPPNTRSGWVNVHASCQFLTEPMSYRLSVLEGFTGKCEAALDEQLLDDEPIALPLGAADGSLTWRQVFSSPIRDRQNAELAATAACAAMTSDCDIDALANIAILKYQCGAKRYAMLRHIEPGLHEVVQRAALDDLADNTVYWRRRSEVERAYYRTAWLAAKCAVLPNGVLSSLVPERRTPVPVRKGVVRPETPDMEFLLDDAPANLEGWWWAEQAYQAYQLMRRAYSVRRGDSDRFSWSRYQYGRTDPASWQAQDPLMAEVVQFKRWARPLGTRSQRLLHAYLAVSHATAQGVYLDTRWLAAHIDLPVTEKEWNDAQIEAQRVLHAQGRRVLFVDHSPVDIVTQ